MKLAMKMIPERWIYRSCKAGKRNLWATDPVYPPTGRENTMWSFWYGSLKLGISGKDYRSRAWKP